MSYTALEIANNLIRLGLKEKIAVSNMKLQKLLYYAQGWYLALNQGRPLFLEDFKKWQFGPVCPVIYEKFKPCKAFPINSIAPCACSVLDSSTLKYLKMIWNTYKDYSASQLSELSHSEAPWKNALQYETISKEAINDFFSEKLS